MLKACATVGGGCLVLPTSKASRCLLQTAVFARTMTRPDKLAHQDKLQGQMVCSTLNHLKSACKSNGVASRDVGSRRFWCHPDTA